MKTELEFYMQFFLWLPLASYILSLIPGKHHEKTISWGTFTSVLLHLTFAIVFVALWGIDGFENLSHREWVLYQTDGYMFYIDFFFDRTTATFLIMGSFLTSLVTVYSRYYLHRESGYKRFFNTLLLFFFGYNLVIFSGNLETLFTGWEVLGISSFLLIAFYRDRYLPVKNALKVFSIYRLGDIGIILAMWLSHHMFHENTAFIDWSSDHLQHLLHENESTAIILSVFLVIAAAAKSAQLPFSSWLPRAMEGPTPSSAIFYGSLSVHMGAFILIRTYDIWSHLLSIKILIILLGVATCFVATGIARVQTSVKSQIAYSSVAQIGIIFCEIALGWNTLALIHIAGNAFLRSYQLLTSPSVVTYLMKDMFYNFNPKKNNIEGKVSKKIEYTFYVLGTREFTINTFLYSYLWNPMKWIGKRIPLKSKSLLGLTTLIFICAILLLIGTDLSEEVRHYISLGLGIVGLVSVFAAFTERENTLRSWLLVCSNHFWVALAVTFNEHYSWEHNIIYLSGVVVAMSIGYMLLNGIKKKEGKLDLNNFYGLGYDYSKRAFAFLLCALAVSGFPITPTFIGEDLIFSHIHEDQIALSLIVSISLIIDGLALVRIYARTFMGPHYKKNHEVADRAS
jgi:NADH:ubiquinone oxidoreductase subunit 5 (subunit L)/multisubunit Na+/H+ antiporter MnhA subunit